ncbi:MAG: teichoic acid biosynthesis protein [Planctomycetaceae bacterium]|nr:teichoic acid biosynthesis protein [Planctomycetaceae bacterium]
MAHIFYSCAGEGRGHATRVRAIVDSLSARHRVTVLAPRDAFELLSPAYLGTKVRVLRIPGLFFHYDRRGRVHYLRTGLAAAKYLLGLPSLVGDLANLLTRERADLVLTDFDPALPRAADRVGVPYVSVDHQSFLRVSDLSSLPLGLRLHARFMELVVRLYYDRPVHRVSSSFYRPPLRPGMRDTTQVGVMLRPKLLATAPTAGNHLVAYFRRALPEGVLDALEELGLEVRLYGLGRAPDRGPIRYLEVSETGFLEDLASARALITTAGNQLVGEAHYLGKAVLAIPEPGNQEQRINGHFLEQGGGGEALEAEQVTVASLRAFLARCPEHEARIDRGFVAGNARALEAIERALGAPTPAEAATGVPVGAR